MRRKEEQNLRKKISDEKNINAKMKEREKRRQRRKTAKRMLSVKFFKKYPKNATASSRPLSLAPFTPKKCHISEVFPHCPTGHHIPSSDR